MQASVDGNPTDAVTPAAAELLAFAEAAVRGEPLDEVRAALVDAVGGDGAAQASATVAAFSGLVRVADGTGIPIDDGLAAASVAIRDDLGLNDFHGAVNTDLTRAVAADFADVDSLWRD
ncbi:MAG: hypothetical protein AAGC53_15070 [Actinomycetota bacterium]